MKTMKKGMALGALMAFVITGSAWAGVTVNGEPYTALPSYKEDTSNQNGGAINHQNGVLTIKGSVFEANTTTARYGKSVYTYNSNSIVSNSKFNNHADSSANGVVYIRESNMLLDGNNVFKGNVGSGVHVYDSELSLTGVNRFLDTTQAIVLTHDGKGSSTLTFKENSTTLLSSGVLDITSLKGNNDVNVEAGATVVSESGFFINKENDELNLNGGTIEIGDEQVERTSTVTILKGENGTIAIDAGWFDNTNKALKVTDNQSEGTVIKARDLDLRVGAKQALENVVDNLKNTVDYSGEKFEFAAAAVDTVLRADLELVDVKDSDGNVIGNKVVTTMDTDDLVVSGDVKATTFNGVDLEEALDGKVDAGTVSGGYGTSLAVGSSSSALNMYATAVGKDTFATVSSTAIGYGAEARTGYSVAVGAKATAAVRGATAIGYNAVANGKHSIAIGTYYEENAYSPISASTGENAENSIAIGGKTNVTSKNSVALGMSSSVTADNSVALGAGSVANEENVISVGSGKDGDAYQYRKIVNVADGDLNATSTDAVNGSQLYATNQKVAGVEAKTQNITATAGNTFVTGNFVAGNNQFIVNAEGDVGVGSHFAIDAQTGNVKTTGILAVGNDKFVVDGATGNVGVSGDVHVAGTVNTAVDVKAQGKYSLVETAEKVAELEYTKADKTYVDTTFAKADNVYTKTEIDSALKLKADKNYVDTTFAKVDDVYTKTEIDNQIASMSTDIAGKADKATTLEGYGITDAYTKAEVNSELAKKADLENVYTKTETDTKIAEKADKADTLAGYGITDAYTKSEVDGMLTDNNAAISGLNQRVERLDGKLDKVGAGAAALAALHPLDYDPEDKLTFSAGVGSYGSEQAAALGMFYRPNEDVMFSLGGTMGNGEEMVNLGVSFALDGVKGLAKMSKAELIQEVNAVKAENETMKAENEAMEDRIERLEALVAELAAKK